MRQGKSVEADTARLSENLDPTFTDTFTVERVTLATDGSDGLNETWAAVVGLTAVPGAIAQDSRPVAEIPDGLQGRIIEVTPFLIHLEAGAAVLLEDRVLHIESGKRYGIVAIPEAVTEEAARLLKVMRVD